MEDSDEGLLPCLLVESQFAFPDQTSQGVPYSVAFSRPQESVVLIRW